MSGTTKRLRIHGEVQGVFYRGWSVDAARGLGVRGWVRNRRDGTVEMLVHGEEDAVARFIALCRQGPRAARVTDIDMEDAQEDVPAGFEQRPTS
jgi:acylphosphatase